MRKEAGLLAEIPVAEAEISPSASPPLRIKTMTTLRAEPVGKSGQPEWLTELVNPIQTSFNCILYCITQMALM